MVAGFHGPGVEAGSSGQGRGWSARNGEGVKTAQPGEGEVGPGHSGGEVEQASAAGNDGKPTANPIFTSSTTPPPQD